MLSSWHGSSFHRVVVIVRVTIIVTVRISAAIVPGSRGLHRSTHVHIHVRRSITRTTTHHNGFRIGLRKHLIGKRMG